jgi:ParB/RepB/Spo0J family partition protein
MESTQVTGKTSKFKYIDPKQVALDKNNPRGETPQQIEMDPEFEQLVDSIGLFGVLDPLIVRENDSKEQPYKLIDGERRLRAALKCDRKEIPIHIVDSKVEAKTLAYQIHMLRKPWGPVSELESIKEIIEELKRSNPQISETEIRVELRKRTNHTTGEIKTLFALSKYDKSTIKKIQGKEGKARMSHLVQGDQSFISPLKRELPDIFNKYGDQGLHNIIAKKAENKKLGKTRYIMEMILPLFNDLQVKGDSRIKEVFKTSIQNFLDNEGVDIEEVVRRVNEAKQILTKTALVTQTTPIGSLTEIGLPTKETTHPQTGLEKNTEQTASTTTLKTETPSNNLSTTTPTPTPRTDQQSELKTAPVISEDITLPTTIVPMQQDCLIDTQQPTNAEIQTAPTPEESTGTTNINPQTPEPTTPKQATFTTPSATSPTAPKQGETHVHRQVDNKTMIIKKERAIIEDGVFNLIFNNLRGAVIEFEKRTSTKFNNERELQHFIYSVLRCLFCSTEFEDPTKKICGSGNRLDFVIRDHCIIIEIKYVRDEVHAKKIRDELLIDYPLYQKSEYGKTIINYIYDPNDYITNQDLFRKELKDLMPKAHHYIQ